MKINYYLLIILLLAGCTTKPVLNTDNFVLDHRFAPPTGQTLICMPDATQKTLVDNNGSLLYDYSGSGPVNGFNISMGASTGTTMLPADSQRLYSPKIPVVITSALSGRISFTTEIFSVAPGLKSSQNDTCEISKGLRGLPDNDIIICRLRNMSGKDTIVVPSFHFNSVYPVQISNDKKSVSIDNRITVSLPEAIESDSRIKTGQVEHSILKFRSRQLKPDEVITIAYSINIGNNAAQIPASADLAIDYKKKTVEWWNNYKLPYDRISVPDSNVQALLYSCIRNIYQSREIRKGLPAFQVGPTCYRGLWIIDGSFLLESMTFLGQAEDVRNGVEYMLGFQKKNGSVLLMNHHWKETGIVLWVIKRHAQLTGDIKWLNTKWDNVVRAVAFIDTMRYSTMKDKNAPNYGLIPPGFSDGGLAKVTNEFTNVYWTLNGLKSAVEIAGMLNRTSEAELWKSKYDSMFACYRKAAEQSLKTDSCGNKAVPTFMTDSCQIQRGQWAFCHAVFPGKIFTNDDPLMRGTMNMLRCNEREGLVYETGWLDKGVWNYFGSFYSHAWLWLGDGLKASQIMYAMANHSSPTLVWREEQTIRTSGLTGMVGDMPHNWASAEFIRMIRHFIALERENGLNLFEGLPPAWTKPGMKTSVKGIYTEFGILNAGLTISDDGKQAFVTVNLDSRDHQPPSAVVIHLDALGKPGKVKSLKPVFPIKETIKL